MLQTNTCCFMNNFFVLYNIDMCYDYNFILISITISAIIDIVKNVLSFSLFSCASESLLNQLSIIKLRRAETPERQNARTPFS